MDPVSPWISQAGLGIVAALLGWWSWNLWKKLNEERSARESREEDQRTVVADVGKEHREALIALGKEHREALAALGREHHKILTSINVEHEEIVKNLIDRLFVMTENVVITNEQVTKAMREFSNGFEMEKAIQKMENIVEKIESQSNKGCTED